MAKKIALGVLCVGLTVDAGAACNDLVLLSEDARYIVLSPENLQIKDAGNLWWLGIRSVDALIAGSTKQNMGIISSRYVNVEDLTPVTETAASASGSSRTIFLLQNLGASAAPDDLVAYAEFSNVTQYFVRDGMEPSTLVRVTKTNDLTDIELLDFSLKPLGRAQSPEKTLGATGLCKSGEEVLIAGVDSVLVTDGSDSSLRTFDDVDRRGGYRILPQFYGCKALFGKIADNDKSLVEGGVVDVANGMLFSSFSRTLHSDIQLIDDGKKVFERIRNVDEVVDADLPAYSTSPTNQLRILDTSTGEVLREATVDINRGRMVGMQSCTSPEEERMIFSDDKFVYLVDVATLEVVAKESVPFMGQIAY